MAKRRRAVVSAEETSIPEGFSIPIGRERGEGWVKKEVGNEVLGRILGRHTYENRGKKRAYYQLKLLKECKIEVDDPDASEDVENPPRLTLEAKVGAIVNVDETAKLTDLAPYAGNGGTYDVWFVYGPQDPEYRDMWTMKAGPRLRVIKRPSELPQDESPF